MPYMAHPSAPRMPLDLDLTLSPVSAFALLPNLSGILEKVKISVKWIVYIFIICFLNNQAD